MKEMEEDELLMAVQGIVQGPEIHSMRASALSVYLLHKDEAGGLSQSDQGSSTDRFDLLGEAT